ncbi:MAG: hypothetical protein ABSF95_12060 [Verrucomicrobiota bacterium]|jgi:hypothetical protein
MPLRPVLPERTVFQGGPSRVSDLEREPAKHLVVRLTNAVAAWMAR